MCTSLPNLVRLLHSRFAERPHPEYAYFESLGILEIDWRPIAQPAEPPYADSHVRWCDREGWRQPTYVY